MMTEYSVLHEILNSKIYINTLYIISNLLCHLYRVLSKLTYRY